MVPSRSTAGIGPSRFRRVAWVLCLVGAVVAFAVTFALTEQTPEQTTALSSSVERTVVPSASPGATIGGGGGVASALLSVANVRRWAHVPEFFVQGLFLFGAAALWPVAHGRRLPRLRVRLAMVLLACAACSLFDQVHKAFVPGREFDVCDLPFDAAGYLLALAVVAVTAAVVRRAATRR